MHYSIHKRRNLCETLLTWYSPLMHSLLQKLGSVSAIIGAQWGDEGKGKVTDILGEHYDVIARACGGANAGHTIVVGGKKHVFRLLPAGCLHEGKPVILGSGMVIHLPTLLEELATLKTAGIDLIPRLMISGGAHIVFDFHKQIDAVQEERREKGIGTTKKGIGPAYADKATRAGIRIERLGDDLRKELEARAWELKHIYDITMDITAELDNLKKAHAVIGGNIVKNLPLLLRSFMEDDKKILIEGAQATLLDLDYGTYPFVTSSYTTLAGALQGLGIAPNRLTSCIGIAKAYCTRVGSGHFPAEDTSERGDRLRARGGEYGSVTGRPRRCGWLSIPDLLYSSCINGFTCINLTKLDVLDEEDVIPVLTETTKDGSPVFVEMKGWKTSTAGIRAYKDLPAEARAYIEFIEKSINVPVSIIGTGQPREDIIVR